MASDLYAGIIFSFIISLREVLEATLIIGIISSYLQMINRKDLQRDILLGIIGAVAFSLSLAWIFLNLLPDLTGYQKLMEGTIMLLAAFVLSWMIIWMNQQAKNIKSEFQKKIDLAITKQQKMGIILLVFFSVAREGAELVLFLYTNYLGNVENYGTLISFLISLVGFTLGVITASGIAFILFRTTKQLDVKKFFQVTSIILLFFAAGLFAHAIHEIYEFLEINGSSLANIFIWVEVWNINNTFIGDILYFLFSWSYDPIYSARFEKSMIGGIIVGLFGWNDNPALIEVIVYVSYLLIVFLTLKRTNNELHSENNKATGHTY